MRKSLLIFLLAGLALTGCASSEPAAEESTPSAEPTPEYATEEQVASVIAEHESDWREVIDNAGDCRFTWVLGDDVTAEIEGLTCLNREMTLGLTAQTAVTDLEALDVPPSMTELVSDTTELLTAIGDIDMGEACGTGGESLDSDACTEAAGSRNIFYGPLEDQLDAWGPYL